jgi:hypothetical protein
MTQNEQVAEVVAKAICRAYFAHDYELDELERVIDNEWADWLEEANAAITAHESAICEDRDLWKQSEETCSRQYDKLLAEHSALRQHAERLAGILEKSDLSLFLHDHEQKYLESYRSYYPKDESNG